MEEKNNTVGEEDAKCDPHWWRGDKTFGKRICARCGQYEGEEAAAPSSTEAPVSVEGAAKTKLDIAEAELSGEELEFFGDQLGNLFDCMNEWAKIVVGDKDIELKLMDEREVLWSNKHAMLNEQLLSANKEVEELKAILQEIDKSLYIGKDLDDTEILKWYLDVCQTIKETIQEKLQPPEQRIIEGL